MKYYVGVDIGGTRVKLGIINELGEVIVNDNVATETEELLLMNQIKDFIDRNNNYVIEGVGISCPGVVKDNGYMQSSGAIKCFLNKNMKQKFEELLKLPVVIVNDANSAAAAEKWIGAGKDIDNFVCITLGTAVGGAIYINGKPYYGLGGMAGEFGMGLIGREKNIYNEQSLSYSAGVVAGLCRNYSYTVKERVLDAKEIYNRAKNGDNIASDCIETFYHDVALLLINVSVFIGPDKILIGGGISSNKEAMENINLEYEKKCKEYHAVSLLEMPKIITCELKNDAGMIGAVKSFLDIINIED